MKKIILLFVAGIIFVTTQAQPDDEHPEIQTIFSKVNMITGFGGPFMSFTTFNGEFAHMMGGGGAALINDSFFFGGFGYGMTTKSKSDKGEYLVSEITFGNGGFWLGYIVKGYKVFHPVISIQSGWGAVTFQEESVEKDTDGVFVLTPTIECEANITKFLRLGLGVNYRWIYGIELNDYTDSDFSAAGVFLSFKFGAYK